MEKGQGEEGGIARGMQVHPKYDKLSWRNREGVRARETGVCSCSLYLRSSEPFFAMARMFAAARSPLSADSWYTACIASA
jgi:hypothetical protein